MSVNGEVTQLLPKQVETAPQTERRSGERKETKQLQGSSWGRVHLAGREITSGGKLSSGKGGECERNLGEQESSRRLPEPINLVSLLLSSWLVEELASR